MEKTIQFYIAGTTFNCTEIAYEKLSSYVEKLKQHFADKNYDDEVIRDIESRIAEKLLEKKSDLITLSEVSEIIKEIGEVGELGSDETGEESTEKTYRRLYRDTDHALIGGVSSGIASYFDIDPIFVRLAFVASIFFGGTGILIYLLLWLVIPEAKTASQKLEMRGEKITFDGIEQVIKKSQNIDKSGLRKVVLSVRDITANLFQVFGKFIGAIIAFFAALGIIGTTILFGALLFNWNQPFNDIIIKESSSFLLISVAAISTYVAIIVPGILILALGIKLLTTKNFLSHNPGFGLLGLWALTIIISGITITTIAADYYKFSKTNPDFTVSSMTYEFDSINELNITDARVVIESGDKYEVIVLGTNSTRNHAVIEETNGKLNLSIEKPAEKLCFFCQEESPTITIKVPKNPNFNFKDSRMYFTNYNGEIVNINSKESNIDGELRVNELNIVSEDSFSDLNVKAGMVNITDNNSNFYFRGQTPVLNLILDNTRLNATNLKVKEAKIDVIESHLQINVESLIKNKIDDDSEISNYYR